MTRRLAPLLWIVLLGAAAAVLYFHDLGSSPPYLSIEEVSQARQTFVFAETGRNNDGQRLPLYFPEDAALRDPVWIYAGAALLHVFPFSETIARATSAAAGVLDVVLMFL